tara:strand:+ start:110 stop:691 length:582 start_codon:yes stop_codon:yes gene_type:complete
MKLAIKIILIIASSYNVNHVFSNPNSLDHEITKIELLCEKSIKRWNGCHQNTLEGWEVHNKRLLRWYQFMDVKNLRLNYLSFLRYKIRPHNSSEYSTMIYKNYAQIVYARACQLRKSMSPYERFQRILAWVMIHKINPVRSGTIRPYFWQILALHEMVQRKNKEFDSICFRQSMNRVEHLPISTNKLSTNLFK